MRAYPFSLTPEISRFFPGHGLGEQVTRLRRAILEGEGFCRVTGPAGSGKTMLCRVVCRELPPTTRVALLLNPDLTPHQLLRAILREWRVPAGEGQGQPEDRQILLEWLVGLRRQGQRAVVLIDEAHCLPLETLAEMRMLGNLETGSSPLLQFVLFGQPVLDLRLAAPEARQILDRFTTVIALRPFSPAGTRDYLAHRLRVAGGDGGRLVSRCAARVLHWRAQGDLRRLNYLAHLALIDSATESAHRVTCRHALHAGRSSGVAGRWPGVPSPLRLVTWVVGMLVGGMAWHAWATGTLSLSHGPDPLPPAREQAAPPVARESGWSPSEPAMFAESRLFHDAAPAPAPHLKPNDPLREPILAAHRWLAAQPVDRLTIQLMQLRDDSGLERLKAQLTGVVPTPEIHLFRIKDGSLLVYLNAFSSREDAGNFLARLPARVKTGGPSIRTMERLGLTVRKLALDLSPPVTG
ncbi:MAG: AAA family ATPase [Magnetococcales bacterium]|nr:AAA family ATPase [Magnetococcales bacterium]